jgi:hypothetical protein
VQISTLDSEPNSYSPTGAHTTTDGTTFEFSHRHVQFGSYQHYIPVQEWVAVLSARCSTIDDSY